MYLDRNQALEQLFKEETKAPKKEEKDKVRTAAEKLAEAVKNYQASIKSGYGRKTKDNKYWKGIVSRILGVSRLYPTRWNEVCEKAQKMGLLEIVVQEESGREYWNVPEETKNPLEEFLEQGGVEEIEEESSEEIEYSDDGVQVWDKIDNKFYPRGKLKALERKRFKKLCDQLEKKAEEEGKEDGILISNCPECGSYEMELYKNSKGHYYCGACNDICYSESKVLWGEKK